VGFGRLSGFTLNLFTGLAQAFEGGFAINFGQIENEDFTVANVAYAEGFVSKNPPTLADPAAAFLGYEGARP